MRLTLRTLLAYLDDTLEPAQTKLIGQKVAESPTAQELIARIKDVVRRRRLTVPPSSGPGAKLDPNTVAEYIDSDLASDQIAVVEEIALESDVHLAEIAACHQILTVILSEPILVPPTARRRMYGLIKGREAIPYRKAAERPATGQIERFDGDGHHEADDTLLLGLPFYKRKGPLFRRLAPIAAVLVLTAGVAFAIWKALPSSDRADVSTTDRTLAQVNGPREDKQSPEAKPDKPAEEAPNKPKDEETTPPKEPAKPEVKKDPVASKETPPPPPLKKEKTPTAPVKGERREVGRYIVDEGGPPSVLLNKPQDADSWTRLRERTPVFTRDTLLSLPGCLSEVALANGTNLTLWGNLPDPMSGSLALESTASINDNPEVDLDVTLERGRIAIANNKPQDQARIRVRFIDDVRWKEMEKTWDVHQDVWEVTLEKGAQVALELFGLYLPGDEFNREPGGKGPMVAMGLFILKGKAELKVRYDSWTMREPRGPAVYFWDNEGQAARGPRTAEGLPPWADRQAVLKRVPAKTRQALSDLSARLTDKKAVDVALSEGLREADPAARELCVYCLAATDDLAALIDALGDEDHVEVRRTSIMALRHWIGIRADNDLRLFDILVKRYKATPSVIIMELLHTFSNAKLQMPETYDSLIAYLKHDKLPIRELAYSHLALLVPHVAQKIPYDPAGGSDQRDRAYDAWKKEIPDGKLPKPPPNDRKPQ